ncbi:MAG: hypothetical protein ACI97Y_000006 [Pseudomonadales bacterium]
MTSFTSVGKANEDTGNGPPFSSRHLKVLRFITHSSFIYNVPSSIYGGDALLPIVVSMLVCSAGAFILALGAMGQ